MANPHPYKPKATFRVALTDECLQTKIDEMGLSFRAENVLKREGYVTIEDIYNNPDGIRKAKNCGIITVKEVFRKIIDKNIETLGDSNPWFGIKIEHWEDKSLWN